MLVYFLSIHRAVYLILITLYVCYNMCYTTFKVCVEGEKMHKQEPLYEEIKGNDEKNIVRD